MKYINSNDRESEIDFHYFSTNPIENNIEFIQLNVWGQLMGINVEIFEKINTILDRNLFVNWIPI